ncbi:FAD-dependent monooxygenase [Actinoplanes sp. M2I2]|uniref:FAD-dependent monooxygenase n=1 Tax=Actinoplanes sp. M2I2 TaxID=1734444 RepID=UPI00202191D7|nr:FAD-dependent monooxygenase [Actinoplanes sp. M2I2]
MAVSTKPNGRIIEADAGRHAVVAGASLVGLTAALALAGRGWRVTVLERSRQNADGMGISIDRALLASITRTDVSRLPTMDVGWTSTGWGLLHTFLSEEVARRPTITVRRGVAVRRVTNGARGAGALVHSDHGDTTADLVVGADGAASTVRRFVAPDAPDAVFSGLVLWRGVVHEADTTGGFRAADLNFTFRSARPGMVATYGIPGTDGGTAAGERRGVFIVFDATRARLLRNIGKLEGTLVRGTVGGGEVGPDLVEELASAAGRWPNRWPSAAATFRSRAFIGTPLAEYRPERLSRGSVVIVGDAAHAVGPTTGAGFHNGMLDVRTLAETLTGPGSEDVPAALRRYEKIRLGPAQDLVARSQRWSRSLTAGAVE